MTQWTKAAKNLIIEENHRFENELKEEAPKTLYRINKARKIYGLPPWKRINTDVVKATILYLTIDSADGDVKRKEDYVIDSFVRVYQ